MLKAPCTRRTWVASRRVNVCGSVRSYRLQQNQYLPPDFFFHPPPAQKGKGNEPSGQEDSKHISDAEWKLRVGRATYLLETTLPEFFSNGLISTPVEQEATENDKTTDSSSSIYSKAIQLIYTPPSPLPSPFPRTLRIEGLALYQASAVFVRTSLIALYGECAVSLQRKTTISPSKREHRIQLRMLVNGKSRLTGSLAEWDVCCTYHFSPSTGLIHLHEVESIDPAPHLHAYDALRAALARLLPIDEPKVSRIGNGEKAPVVASPQQAES